MLMKLLNQRDDEDYPNSQCSVVTLVRTTVCLCDEGVHLRGDYMTTS